MGIPFVTIELRAAREPPFLLCLHAVDVEVEIEAPAGRPVEGRGAGIVSERNGAIVTCPALHGDHVGHDLGADRAAVIGCRVKNVPAHGIGVVATNRLLEISNVRRNI